MHRAFVKPLLMLSIWLAPVMVPSLVLAADSVLVVTPSGEKVFKKKASSKPAQRPSANAVQSGVKPNVQWQMLDQVEKLQQEVQLLRGQLEEQAYKLKKIQSNQRDRYIDLDRRISDLSKPGSRVVGSSSPVPTVKASPVNLDVKGMDDRKLYNTAQEFVQNRQFDQAITLFNKLFENYPDSRYVANGHYWLGEVYMAMPQPNLDEASAHFLTVLETYPDHSKVPASLYKLGKVSDLMGDNDRAIKYLKKVVEQYPSSSSAGLGRQYIQNLMTAN